MPAKAILLIALVAVAAVPGAGCKEYIEKPVSPKTCIEQAGRYLVP